MKQRLKNLYLRLRHLFPSELPKTVAEFEVFALEVFRVHGLPEKPSYYQALAQSIMHLGPVTSRAPKAFFARSIKKAMANHAAFDKIQQLREAEKEFEAEVRANSNGIKEVQDLASQVVS